MDSMHATPAERSTRRTSVVLATILTAGILGLGATSAAAQATLIDIRPGAAPSLLGEFVEFQGKLFFAATDATSGVELWMSDGTAGGTVLVKDINPGGSSNPQYLTVVDGTTLYFAADDGTNGVELWKSDGTALGTAMVANLNPTGSSSPQWLTAYNSQVFFAASNGFTSGPQAYGVELYKSDGFGVSLVKDLFPGGIPVLGIVNSGSPQYLTVSGSPERLFFQATDATNGTELWVSDGSTGGTVLVKDIYPGISVRSEPPTTRRRRISPTWPGLSFSRPRRGPRAWSCGPATEPRRGLCSFATSTPAPPDPTRPTCER